jgi:chemotaxis protein methyltransferase CheR
LIGSGTQSLDHIAFEGKKVSRSNRLQSCGNGGHCQHRNFSLSNPVDHEHCLEFIASILKSAGLPPDAYRASCMNRRSTACLRTLKAATVDEARRRLAEHPDLGALAIDFLLIGVTDFFRDTAVFNSLREILARDLSTRDGLLRIWSAGCSRGTELYSVAILLAEERLLERSQLLGTDCRTTAIREAQDGTFSEAGLPSVDASLRLKYFRNAGGHWQLTEQLRRRMQWRVRNLFSGAEAGPWDIILWRNMAIYLKQTPARRIWDALVKEMRPGGLLIVGKAERPPASAGLVCLSPCIYQLR